MRTIEYYLLVINGIGFMLYIINMLLYRYTEKGNVDIILTITALFGASAGILLAICLFDRKTMKENMMSRVFIACVFVIQVVIFLILKGHHADKITLSFWIFFAKHKALLMYLGVINLVSLVAFAIDKINALEKKSRIRIVTLLGVAFIGGSVGALLGMYLFHHKTRKDYFAIGVPMILITQIVVLFYVMNTGL